MIIKVLFISVILTFIPIKSSYADISGCSYNEYRSSSKIDVTDDNSSFSFTIPKKWKVKKSHQADFSEMILKPANGCNLSIYSTSRKLSLEEKKLTQHQLIDIMNSGSLSNLKKQGHQILNYGKHKELKDNFPAVVIVSYNKNENKMAISVFTIDLNRNYSIISLFDADQDNSDVSDILRQLISSYRIH